MRDFQEIFCNHPKEMQQAREELERMLHELSDDALRYVWRPILYAYSWTDEHDMNAMTEDDSLRYGLIRDAALEGAAAVKQMALMCRGISRAFRAKAGGCE